MNYRDFLSNKGGELRLPCPGGHKVCNNERSWRVREALSPGWYRFREQGRYLEVVEPIDSELANWDLPAVRGYLAQGRFITDASMARLHGVPADEDVMRYSPVAARRWFDRSLWFEMVDFESEVHEAVRQAFEDETGIVEIKGVTPALAQAYLLENAARTLAREAERRRQEEEAAAERAARLLEWQQTIEGRIAVALSHSGAELLDWRRSGGSRATVRYVLGARRFECVVDTETLQILDAGICLEGADQMLNLSSLPSAVREAIDSGQLYVFRR